MTVLLILYKFIETCFEHLMRKMQYYCSIISQPQRFGQNSPFCTFVVFTRQHSVKMTHTQMCHSSCKS